MTQTLRYERKFVVTMTVVINSFPVDVPTTQQILFLSVMKNDVLLSVLFQRIRYAQ